MTDSVKKGLRFVFVGVLLFAVSLGLALAVDQAISLVTLRVVSASSGPEGTDLMKVGLWLGNDLLLLGVVTALLFYLVFVRSGRLLPVIITAAVIFVALNLFSGRHLLPQLLVTPTPAALAEQYVLALSHNDLEAALRLTDQSEQCDALVAEQFRAHRERLIQSVGHHSAQPNIRAVTVKSLTTFYEKPVPQGFVLLPPVPKQLVTVVAETESARTLWLNLRMSYQPIVGRRYVCGEEIDAEA